MWGYNIHEILIVSGFGGIIAFIITFLIMPWLIQKLMEAGIVGIDLHKMHRPSIPEMGGLGILFGIASSVIVGIITLPLQREKLVIVLFILLLVALFGALDDLFNLSAKIKLSLPILFGVPLLLVSPSSTIRMFSLTIDLSFFYWIIILFWLMIAINTTNMLAGLNGVEAGLGAIVCFNLWVVAFFIGTIESTFVLAISTGALLAFLWYNKYPAKIFPGNIGVSLIGAIVVVSAVIGKFEFLALIAMMPYFLDALLKLWSAKGILVRYEHFPTQITSNGKLFASTKNYLSLIRIFIKKKPLSEKEIVAKIWLLGFGFGILAVLITMLEMA